MLRHGSDAPPAAAIPLKAGPLEMVFEPDGAFLRYVRLGRREILRGVYAAVRDPERWTAGDPTGPLERAVALVAARAGHVRLIDNLPLSAGIVDA